MSHMTGKGSHDYGKSHMTGKGSHDYGKSHMTGKGPRDYGKGPRDYGKGSHDYGKGSHDLVSCSSHTPESCTKWPHTPEVVCHQLSNRQVHLPDSPW